MRLLLCLLLLLFPGPAAAQFTVVQPVQRVPAWTPASDYVTAGQDEAGYRRWLLAYPPRGAQVAHFQNYLNNAGVGSVAPAWQLLRTASQWQRCYQPPFEVPPLHEWPNIVQTLRYVRDYVVPIVGPVEPVSSYRNPVLNQCAGGARESVHQHWSAVDLVPLYPTDRNTMMRRLCATHYLEGPRYSVGLGFYSKLRFHVDSWKFRTWGSRDGGGIACAESYALAHAPPAPPTVTTIGIGSSQGPSGSGVSVAPPMTQPAIRVAPPIAEPAIRVAPGEQSLLPPRPIVVQPSTTLPPPALPVPGTTAPAATQPPIISVPTTTATAPPPGSVPTN